MLKTIAKKLSRVRQDQDGATAIEYGLLAALIAVAIVLVVKAVGSNLGEAFNSVQDELGKAPAAQIQPK
jgi:pilus assembly protein Flp/PilA